VISMLRYMLSRSSRSRPASLISLNEPTGSALVAIAKAGPTVTTSLPGMGKASDWLREERRKVLGDWVAFCLSCGAAQRWFEEFEDDVARECPQCGGEMLRRCPSCNAPFTSVFAVQCESCRSPLREDELFGSKIRRT
jgi:predicted RNA-binding Zn-ribbon protein involved in translation (DUF1610 family)